MALVKIGKAAEMLGVTPQTLLAWDRSGELVPDRRSSGGTRYYDVGKVMGLGNEDMPTIGTKRRTELIWQLDQTILLLQNLRRLAAKGKK